MSMHGHRRCAGYTLVEVLVTVLILGVVLGAAMRLFEHFSRSFTAIDDHLENVAETWQVATLVREDLQCGEAPPGEDHALQRIDGGYRLYRRRGAALHPVTYAFDPDRGTLSRAEQGRHVDLLHGRCRFFLLNREALAGDPASATPLCYTMRIGVAADPESSKGAHTQGPMLLVEARVSPLYWNLKRTSVFVDLAPP